MAEQPEMVEKRIDLSRDQASRLSAVAQRRGITEDAVVARAFDLRFTVLDFVLDFEGAEQAKVQQRGVLTEQEREALAMQRLVELGLISHVRPMTSAPPGGDRTLIQVRGKPLSEMIIEERR